jgi:hypothetical protein
LSAQEFYAVFNLGDSDKAISTVDADGIVLNGSQGLYEITQTGNNTQPFFRNEGREGRLKISCTKGGS